MKDFLNTNCIYCEHFNYNLGTIEREPFKEELCLLKKQMRSPFSAIFEKFELRSGVYLKKRK